MTNQLCKRCNYAAWRKVRLFLLTCACILVMMSLLSTSTAWADESSNTVGSSISVTVEDAGTLEFAITVAAGNNAAGEVTLTKGTEYTGASLSIGGVQQEVGGVVYDYNVTKVAASAFSGNTSLTRIEFTSNLTGVSPAIGASAFANCKNLSSVLFPQKTAGIGSSAFSGCTALQNVAFPDNSELYYVTYLSNGNQLFSPAIGNSCFADCTSLKTISIPPIMTALRKGSMYATMFDYSPTYEPFTIEDYFTSGYMAYWHNGAGPVVSSGIGNSVFSGCSTLESVVFEAGNEIGMFAYWMGDVSADNAIFSGCTSLDSLIFEGAQPYFGNPNASLLNQDFRDIWENAEAQVPSYYYAVDYYATENAASADDGAASNRIARVEYLRNTPTSAIATSDSATLDNYRYTNAEAYQKKETDGVIPNAKQAAIDAGLDTAESKKEWIWKLGSTQSRREGLSDSCYAYLAEVNDISTGRIDSVQTEVLYKLCDQNLSQGSVQDTAFDVERYYYPDRVVVGSTRDAYTITDLDEGSPWFTLASAVEESFFGQVEVCAADGSVLDKNTYAISFQRYDDATKTYVAAELGDEDGPLLMTITPSVESGYTGVLQEWVMVKGHAGSVLERYTDSSSDTWRAAVYANGDGYLSTVSFDGPYAVSIGSADVTSALVGVGIAGVTKAPLSVGDTDSSNYGITIATEFYSNGVITGGRVSFANDSARFETASSYAVAVYQTFNNRRDSLGVSTVDYPWGNTAVLVQPNTVNQVAGAAGAYAYAKEAPVFYTKEDGTISPDTLECLSDFSEVVAIGDRSMISDDALAAVRSSRGTIEVSRIGGDVENASSLSVAVAEILNNEGEATTSLVSLSDATDPIDALSSLNFSGHEGGLTLVATSTADSKSVSKYLYEQRDNLDTIRVFGRNNSAISSDTFNVYDSLCDVWSDAYEEPSVDVNDTLELHGALFVIEEDNILSFSSDIWPHSTIASGDYTVNGIGYSLSYAVESYEEALDISAAEISLSRRLYTETGSPITPEPSVTMDGKTLLANTDYTLSYKDNFEVGTATITVTGIGNYTGTATASFSIVQKASLGDLTLVPVFSWIPGSNNSNSSGGGSSTNTNQTTTPPTSDSTGASTSTTGTGTLTAGTTTTGTLTTGTVAAGTLTSGTTSSGTLTTGTTSPSTTGAGSLNLSVDSSEDESGSDGWLGTSSGENESRQATDSDSGQGVSNDQNAWSNESDGATAGSNENSGLPPVAVGVIVAVVVAGVGASLWYALRRKPEMDPDLEMAS